MAQPVGQMLAEPGGDSGNLRNGGEEQPALRGCLSEGGLPSTRGFPLQKLEVRLQPTNFAVTFSPGEPPGWPPGPPATKNVCDPPQEGLGGGCWPALGSGVGSVACAVPRRRPRYPRAAPAAVRDGSSAAFLKAKLCVLAGSWLHPSRRRRQPRVCRRRSQRGLQPAACQIVSL